MQLQSMVAYLERTWIGSVREVNNFFSLFFIKIFNLLGVFHAAPEHGRLP